MEAKDYLNAAAKRAGSVRAISQHIRRSESFLSQIRSDRKPIPPYIAAQCASMEGLNPMVAAVEAMRDGAESAEEKLFWAGVLADHKRGKTYPTK